MNWSDWQSLGLAFDSWLDVIGLDFYPSISIRPIRTTLVPDQDWIAEFSIKCLYPDEKRGLSQMIQVQAITRHEAGAEAYGRGLGRQMKEDIKNMTPEK